MKKRTTKISTSDFPTDLLVEILSRLPFKSFYRFKTVSKSWLSLSLDPYYRKKLPQPPSALMYESLDPISNKHGINFVQLNSSAQSIVDTPFGFLPHFERTEILDYCNGLFLCFCLNYSPNIKRLFVCNPANSRYFALPFPTNFDYKFVLAFDPHVSSHFHVLKFEETKIDWETSLITGLTVFSSYSTNWVERKISLRVEFEFARTPSAFHNGVVYKLVNKAILAIKFEDLSMELIPLPIQATSGWYGRIGISEKSLVYMVKKEEEILIWSLIGANENKEWIVKYRLSITKIFGSDAFFFRHYPRLISFHPEQGVVFFTGANEVNKIFSFDCSNGEMCDIFSLESKIVIQSFFYVSCYVDCISANN